jgi:hypothetical protein
MQMEKFENELKNLKRREEFDKNLVYFGNPGVLSKFTCAIE